LGLILRSGPKDRVSKDGTIGAAPIFRDGRKSALLKMRAE